MISGASEWLRGRVRCTSWAASTNAQRNPLAGVLVDGQELWRRFWGFLGRPRLSVGDYVAVTGPTDGAPAPGGLKLPMLPGQIRAS